MSLRDFLLIGAACLFVLVFQLARRKRQMKALADGVRRLQRSASQESRCRPVRADERWLDESRELYESATRELGENGFIVLGDLVEEDDSGKAAGQIRWFADEGRTVCGWFAPVLSGRTKYPAMFLFSESDSSEFFVTLRGPSNIHAAPPPSVHRAYCPWDVGLPAALLLHLDAISTTGAGSGFRRSDDLDAARALQKRLGTTVARWRASQPADELLVQDLRSILGDRFDELSPALLRLMRSGSDPATESAWAA